MMTGKQMMHQNILTHNFFRNNPRTLDEGKHKCELMMMIFDSTLPHGGIQV
jgi:hypothetical protein